MNDDSLRFNNKSKSYFHINSEHNIRILFLFFIGLLIAIITSCIGQDSYISAEVRYAQSIATTDFVTDSDAAAILLSIIKKSFVELVCIILAFTASITIFAKTSFTILTLFKGFNFGRICGCVVFILYKSFSHPLLSSIATLVYLLAVNIVYIVYSVSCTKSKPDPASGEISLLFSEENGKRVSDLLSAIGTIILFTLIKSFIISLISRI